MSGRGAAPKRFYRAATIAATGAGFTLLLDGAPAKTAARADLATPVRALADAMAEEWNAQVGTIEFPTMPMTRYRMTAIDRAELDAPNWRAATLAFLASDAVCYRAHGPEALLARQQAAWDPLLDWAGALGVRLKTTFGVGYVPQPAASILAAAELLANADCADLPAIKDAAEIAGSAVIALALWRRAFPADALFAAACIDEEFQAGVWGRDREAEARARRLEKDFLEASRYLSLNSAAG